MTESSFSGAGAKTGLELWRIENLHPVKQEKIDGKFYKGDSYILLATTAHPRSGALNWNIHFWLGSETSNDESGIAAYKSVELDDQLGGGPTQHREVEGNESPLFLSYFKSGAGIEYLAGGIESGFRRVVADVYETRLLHLKGKRTVRVNSVPVARESLNQGDVFILDAGLKIFIFNGPSANKFEKMKGMEVAHSINSDSRGGRAEVVYIDDDEECAEFWGPLGGFVNPSSLPAGEDDHSVVVPKVEPKLFRISDESGAVEFSEVPLEGGKLVKDLLHTGDVFLVHSASSKIFIWVGRGASLSEKREATARATQYITQAGLPKNTAVERLSEGVETSAFKAAFAKWDVVVAHKSGVAGTPADASIDVGALLARHDKEDTPLDDGSGKLQIWVVQDFKLAAVEPELYGQFFGGDSYVLQYTYIKNRREEDIIYFWLGAKSSIDEIGAAALLAKERDDAVGGRAVQVRVVQGKEPAHFRQLFKGCMVVHSGGKASSFKNSTEGDSFDTDGVALFHVHGSNALNTLAIQVQEKSSSLNSADCFVLVTPSHVFAWRGNSATEEEANVSLTTATSLAANFLGTGGRVVESVTEGSEPEAFWEVLGGRSEYPSLAPGTHAPKDPRLFQCSDAFGPFNVEEIADFAQSDLLQEDVFLLDLFTTIFVWVGAQSNQKEQEKANAFAHRFVEEAQDGRSSDIPVVVIHAGQEPTMFTSHFVGWEEEPEGQRFVDPYQAKLAKAHAEKAARLAEQTGVAPALHHVTTSVTAPAHHDGTTYTAPAHHVEAHVADAAHHDGTTYTAPAHHVEAHVADAAHHDGTSYTAPAHHVESTHAAVTAAATPAAYTTPLHHVSPPAPVTGTHSAETLKEGIPSGVDPTRKEEYLDDATFLATFGSDKATFAAMPKWKRDAKKKEFGLF